MQSINLTDRQVRQLEGLGLIEITTNDQRDRGFRRFIDTESGAKYSFSPRGYVWRTTPAGTYQVNPRFLVPTDNATIDVKATVRTNSSKALLKMATAGIRNYRN
jgi:hypothetical protein